MKFTEQQIEKLIKDIEEGDPNSDISVEYYNALIDYFSGAVLKGFPEAPIQAPEILNNIYHFSAAKAFQQNQALQELLHNSKSAKDFNAEAKQLYNNWNNNWGITEYNTAQAASEMASKWQDIENNKDIVPNLKYSAIGDACSICAPLNDLVAPVDDPIWDTVYPVNHPNCFCTVLQVDEKVTDNYKQIVEVVSPKMNDTFKNNIGKTGQVFTEDHPYFDAPKDIKEDNFGFEMPTTEVVATTIEQAIENEKVWIEGLSEAEKNVVSEYTTNSGSKWNHYLRTGDEKKLYDHSKDQIELVSKTLEAAPKYEGIVYRGLGFNEEHNSFIEQLSEGNIFVDKGFMSTTYKKENVYGAFTSGKSAVIFEINCKSGTLIEHLSQYANEKEILLNKNSKFVIDKVEHDKINNIYNVKMTQHE